MGWRGQPRRVRAGRGRVFGPGSPARQRRGEAPQGRKRSPGTPSPGRAWVERDGAPPVRVGHLPTAKSGGGPRIARPHFPYGVSRGTGELTSLVRVRISTSRGADGRSLVRQAEQVEVALPECDVTESVVAQILVDVAGDVELLLVNRKVLPSRCDEIRSGDDPGRVLVEEGDVLLPGRLLAEAVVFQDPPGDELGTASSSFSNDRARSYSRPSKASNALSEDTRISLQATSATSQI